MPDYVIVRDFDATPAEILLDRGIAPQIGRELGSQSQSAEEAKVGEIVADAIVKQLVVKLRSMGIAAYHSSDLMPATSTTLVIKGYLMHVDQGDQNLRVVIGFGLGGSTVRTQILGFQDGLLAFEGDTETASNLKPGIALSVVGGAPAVAVSAGSAGFSEAFWNTVKADADRTADKIAGKIRDGYVKRGWLVK